MIRSQTLNRILGRRMTERMIETSSVILREWSTNFSCVPRPGETIYGLHSFRFPDPQCINLSDNAPESGAASQPSTSYDLAELMDAAAVAEAHRFDIFQTCAQGLEWAHTTMGLPWWATIPLCTLSLRLALLPWSLRQAKIVRSSYMIYKEAVTLTDQQQGLSHGSSSSDTSSSSADSSPSARTQLASSTSSLTTAQRLKRTQAILRNFALLRQKCEAPHPIWILVNPMIQMPCFMVMGLTLRAMGVGRWPGLIHEGTLWFPDLTKAPLIIETMETPLGAPGFILPGLILAMTLTSLRRGFGASGTKLYQNQENDNFGKLLAALPPLLYTLTILGTYFKVQQPHAALLHWATSSAFTLSLQMGLQTAMVRETLHILPAQQVKDMLARMVAPPKPASSSGPLYSESTLPSELVEKVRCTHSADVLVVMGAQLSAKHRYSEAMFCLDRALALHSSHVRAHYSKGQVFSLVGRWQEAQRCFREAAEKSPEGSPEKGQALYCVATSLHTQGDLKTAISMYREAEGCWRGQTVISYSLTNALLEAGRSEEAKEVLIEAMNRDSKSPGRPFAFVLQRLASKLGLGQGVV
ncbi:hypothetical protein CEUSTIGMA_g6326.t1 [Chlamydomonas eustigma]|uniref:Uncharacterized protein n=1 Tax=Chlamydomonas eustigma TaxID=1157962 RepID=A0A250X739_9CHLO|nr:hypothetical protein CEUSTIGMA_g6326.t1 [Chlamydomonas eustigma]|eukprot:GAX78887.1 hypothetical protein CEUSTIGMA_g6326.t1 [Chlamydomonas eustigma]